MNPINLTAIVPPHPRSLAPDRAPAPPQGAPDVSPPQHVKPVASEPQTQPQVARDLEAHRRDVAEAVAKAVERANQRSAQLFNRRVVFAVDKETEQIVIRVIDTETDEIIRQIPPEEWLRIADKLTELRGLFIDSQG